MKQNKKGKITPTLGNSKKTDKGIVLSIINLILTAVIGIGVTIYLNIRNEKFQEQLVNLQSKAQLAKITFDTIKPTYINSFKLKTSEPYGFIISNNGPATATNLRLAICAGKKSILIPFTPLYIREDIPNLNINSISPFSIFVEEISSEINTEITSARCFDDSSFVDNLFILSIPSLPPSKKLHVRIEISGRLPHKIVEINRDVHMLIPPPSEDNISDSDLINFAEQNFRYYFSNNYHTISDFTIEATCDNCITEESLLDDNYNLYFSNVKEWSLAKLPIMLSRADGYLEMAFSVDYSLYVPQGYDSNQNNTPLYLWQGYKVEKEKYENMKKDLSTPHP